MSEEGGSGQLETFNSELDAVYSEGKGILQMLNEQLIIQSLYEEINSHIRQRQRPILYQRILSDLDWDKSCKVQQVPLKCQELEVAASQVQSNMVGGKLLRYDRRKNIVKCIKTIPNSPPHIDRVISDENG